MLVDFIPYCLKSAFKYGEISTTQKEQLLILIAEIKKVIIVNQIYETELEPYLCFLNYLNSGDFENRDKYEKCLSYAIKLLKNGI